MFWTKTTWKGLFLIPVLLLGGLCWGQGEGGGGREGFRQEMEALQKKYRYNFMLRDTFYKTVEMEKQKKAPLSKVQAQKILGIVTPLRKKPKLTSDEAKQNVKKMQAVLTAKQLQTLSLMKPPSFRQGRGGSGSKSGGSGNGNRGGGSFDPQQMRQRMQQRFKDYNPFYISPKPVIPANASPEEAQRTKAFHAARKKMLTDALAVLEKKAKS